MWNALIKEREFYSYVIMTLYLSLYTPWDPTRHWDQGPGELALKAHMGSPSAAWLGKYRFAAFARESCLSTALFSHVVVVVPDPKRNNEI